MKNWRNFASIDLHTRFYENVKRRLSFAGTKRPSAHLSSEFFLIVDQFHAQSEIQRLCQIKQEAQRDGCCVPLDQRHEVIRPHAARLSLIASAPAIARNALIEALSLS